MAPGLYGLMGTLPPRGAHLSGSRQLILRITEKKSGIQDIDIFTDQNLIILSCVPVQKGIFIDFSAASAGAIANAKAPGYCDSCAWMESRAPATLENTAA